jgi:N-acetylmuramoyl-L-alanine amidase|tara:strand:+ start:839 stop:1576 length:738 start_codon:yes stop_codon:yes gene_type:complete
MKIFTNYSPNFNPKKRKTSQIKFLIFHYTGMKKESNAIKKLTNSKSKVSCHYFIKNNGETLVMVPDLYVAWHAGKSQWKNYRLLNKNSIGVEINNPGHEFNYKKFSKKQVQSIITLSEILIKKYKIKSKNILGHSDIAPERKNDPGEKFPWKQLAKRGIGLWHSISIQLLKKNRKIKLDKNSEKIFYDNLSKIGYITKNSEYSKNRKFNNCVVKAFQRRFRQELINGKVDKECLIISKNIIKKFN